MKQIDFKDQFKESDNRWLEKGQNETYSDDYVKVLIKEDLEHGVEYINIPERLRV